MMPPPIGASAGTATKKAAPQAPTDPAKLRPLPLTFYTPGAGAGTGVGGAGSLIDPNIVNKILANSAPITYTPTTYTQIPYGKVPAYQSSNKATQQILNTAAVNALKLLNSQKANIANFGKYIQNLPDLTGLAQQNAWNMLAPQIQTALTGGVNQADAITALGRAASALQQTIGANVSNAYNSSGKLLSALAGGLGGTISGALNQGLSAIPTPPGAGSALAAGNAPGGMTLAQLAPGLAGGLQALQGTVPAVGLVGQGLNAQQATQDAAQVLLGGAKTGAMGAIAAANQKANDLAAQLPTLQNQAFNQLSTQQSQQISAMKDYLTTNLGLTEKEATAVMDAAKTSAAAFQKDIAGLNTYNTQNANRTTRIDVANAAGQNRTDIANARLAEAVNSRNMANVNTQFNNYIKYIKATTGGGAGQMTANEIQSVSKAAAQQLWKWAYGTKPSTRTTTSPSSGGQPTISKTGGTQPMPVRKAWMMFQAEFPKLHDYLGDEGFQNLFKSVFQLPSQWGVVNLMSGVGPIGVNPDGSQKMGNRQDYMKAGGGKATTNTYYTGGGASGSRGQGGGNAATETSYKTIPFTGVTTAGIQPTMLARVSAAAQSVGASSIEIISGKRSPGPGNDVPNSNHITGNAMDAVAVFPDGRKVPLGTAIKSVASQFGLRSGDQAGFDPKTSGGYDPNHVDDGANVNNGQPLAWNNSQLGISQLPYTGQNPGFQLLPAFGGQQLNATELGYNPSMVATSQYPSGSLQQIAAQAAMRYGIDPNAFIRQINQESGFNPNAKSSAGAEGIAQFMPATAKGVGLSNPYDPISALDAAAKYMSQLVNEYGSLPSALSAYNSGNPNAYKNPNFAGGQTYNYVRSILGYA